MMERAGIGATVAAIGFLIGAASVARAEPLGAAGGKLVIEAGGRDAPITPRSEAGDGVALELRRGGRFVVAQLQDDGTFVFEAPAGTYRLEYIVAGDRAEFVAPMEVRVRAGKMTCAGTLTVKVARLEELGANVHNELSATDECEELEPRLTALWGRGGGFVSDLARAGPRYETRASPSVRSLLSGLRLELTLGSELAARAHYWLPLEHLAIPSRLVFLGGPGLLMGEEAGYDVTFAAGFRALGWEVLGATGYRWRTQDVGSEGVVAGAMVRGVNYLMGLGVRGELLPEPAAMLTIDLAPFGILGALL